MADADWVTLSEAARRAGVHKSSISRFLANNPDVPARRNGAGQVQQVEFGALALARSGSLAVQDSGPERAPLADVIPFSGGAQSKDATSRKRAAEAEKAELDLAQRKGELLSRQAVTDAVVSAGVAFTQGLERRRRALAQAVAGMDDIRALELALKKSDGELLEGIMQDLKSAAASQGAPLAQTA